MGGSSKTESKTTVDPAQLALYQQNYTRANQVADDYAYKPYTGERVAGFNPTQIQSQGILSGIATDPRYHQANQDAMGQIQGVLGSIPNGQITPQNYTASTYDPAQLAGTDLSPYMNPFQKDVIDASIAQNGYARDQQGVKDNAAATAAHAFGGTRQAVQAAETTGAYDRNNQQNIAALNSANFGQAQQGALSDINARNQAGAFNANVRNAASQFNSGQDFNAQQNSFGNMLAAQGLRMDASGRLAALNANDFNMATQQGGILSAIGDAQQGQQQHQNDASYEEFLRQLQTPLQAQQLRNQALTMMPLQQTQTGTTTSSSGLGGILGAVGSLGLAAATGGTSLGLTGALGGLGGLFGSKALGASTGGLSGIANGWN